MAANNDIRRKNISRRRRRRRGYYIPVLEFMKYNAARFARKYTAQILIACFITTGLTAGSIATYHVMNWRFEHMQRDYGRELAYTSYTVMPGDTMWSIAADMAALNPEFTDMRQYLYLLQKTNKNYGDTLLSGSRIIIPYYRSGTGRDFISIYEKYGIVEELENSKIKNGGTPYDN